MPGQIVEQMHRFSQAYGKDLAVGGTRWRYYRVGAGPALLWLTGGLRRVAFGYGFMERLAERHTVIAPDYPPARSFGELVAGFEAILRAEGVERYALGGQSYGGLLAQGFLALRPAPVERLILSSSGPADFGMMWLPADYLAVFLARVLPERSVKGLLAGGLMKVVSAPQAEREEWLEAVRETINHDLAREDVVSHFAVAADMIRKRIVRPEAFKGWPPLESSGGWSGRVVVLSAENDPTQGKGDRARYEALFERPIEMVSLGTMGHTAALFDPERYVALLEQALA